MYLLCGQYVSVHSLREDMWHLQPHPSVNIKFVSHVVSHPGSRDSRLGFLSGGAHIAYPFAELLAWCGTERLQVRNDPTSVRRLWDGRAGTPITFFHRTIMTATTIDTVLHTHATARDWYISGLDRGNPKPVIGCRRYAAAKGV